jgi:DNA-binding LacI/PurR family transcriptional regulator
MKAGFPEDDSNRGSRASAPATIIDIANLCGVSPASVSRVLTGLPGVKAAKRKKILETSSQLGYRPNRAARRLVTQKSQLLGFIASDLRNTAYLEYFHILERAVRGGGYEFLIADSERSSERERTNIERMLDNRVDGLVILPVSDWLGTDEVAHLRHLESLRMPCVLLGHLLNFQFDSISPDEYGATALLVDHLWELGHRRFGFVRHADAHNRPAMERLEGTTAALAKHGYPAGALRVGAFEKPGWENTVLGWLSEPDAPTAIICVNDLAALRLLRPFHAAGISVPEHVSLCGFGRSWIAENDVGAFFYPSLTVVDFDSPVIAEGGANMLLRRIANAELPLQTIRVPARLVARESTAPPPP